MTITEVVEPISNYWHPSTFVIHVVSAAQSNGHAGTLQNRRDVIIDKGISIQL